MQQLWMCAPPAHPASARPVAQGACRTTHRVLFSTPAAAAAAAVSAHHPQQRHTLLHHHHSLFSSSRQAVRVQAWTQVVDQASGKPYYWNTDTNETAWEIPSSPPTPTSSTATATSTVPQSTTTQQEQQQQQQERAAEEAAAAADSMMMSNDDLFEALSTAYHADGSGMEFWEVARAHRKYGVFEPPFFEYLEQLQQQQQQQQDKDEDKEAAGGGRADMAFKMMCRLSNPLLRQPAPFE